ncbi:MAG: DUF296 domain-containing protein [Saccharofermentans sp.]|nr:DUF296 domain-containing protein [Saccharofermentans sp.]
MEYRKIGDTYYIRFDRGDEIVSGILDICRNEKIESAVYSGIGGLSKAEIQTFVPEKGEFETDTVEGMLELVSVNGNLVMDREGNYFHHTHSLVAYKEDGKHLVLGGHTKSLTVLYTGEIELRPVIGGAVRRRYNPETGTGFWDFAAN